MALFIDNNFFNFNPEYINSGDNILFRVRNYKEIKTNDTFCISIPTKYNIKAEHEMRSNDCFSFSSYLFNDIKLKEKRFDFFSFEAAEIENSKYLFAIITAEHCDALIPVSLKEKVKLIKKINYLHNDEINLYKNSTIYFIKIVLTETTTLPIFFATVNSYYYLSKHYIFSKDIGNYSASEYETFIKIGKHNKSDFISLSKL